MWSEGKVPFLPTMWTGYEARNVLRSGLTHVGVVYVYVRQYRCVCKVHINFLVTENILGCSLGSTGGNLSHSFFYTFFASSRPWPHPLISKCSRPSNQKMVLQTESCLKCQKGAPTRWKERFLHPFVQEPCADQAFSIASCNSRHVLSPGGWHPFTSPCHTSCASAKPIFKTDNMWPNLDDDWL